MCYFEVPVDLQKAENGFDISIFLWYEKKVIKDRLHGQGQASWPKLGEPCMALAIRIHLIAFDEEGKSVLKYSLNLQGISEIDWVLTQ